MAAATKPPAAEGVEPDAPQPPRWALERALRGLAAREQSRPSDVYREFVPGRDPASCFQYHFHRSGHTIRALSLGNGAGKTTTCGVEADWWLQHRHPYLEVPRHRVQVVWVTLKYAQLDMMREQLEAVCLTRGWNWNDKYHKYVWQGPHGPDELYVVSNDADWGTIQGVNPDLVVVDEECDRKLWGELQARRRIRKRTRYVIAATATKGRRWMFGELFEPWIQHHQKLGLTEDQAMLAQGHERVWMWAKGGVEDNPSHTAEDVDWYHHGMTFGSEAERRVRLHGGFADFNASPVFDPAAVARVERRLKAEALPGLVGWLKERPPAKWRHPMRPEYRFLPNDLQWQGGRITIYEPPLPDTDYVEGGDFAQGLEHGDFDAAVVCRTTPGRRELVQVAEAEGRWGTGPITFVLYALAWLYNEALIVGEANAMGMAALRRLYDELGYSRVYTRPERPDAKPKRKSDLLGYHKGQADRVIRRLQWAVRPFDTKTGRRGEPRIWLRSPRAVDQLRRYELRPRAKRAELGDAPESSLIMAAPRGYNDDLVSALAGCVEGWWELRHFPKREEPEYEPDTLGHLLKHKEVLAAGRAKKKGAFTYGPKPKR